MTEEGFQASFKPMAHTTDEVRAFFDAHWTVRKYKKVEMPPEHLDVILHAAQRAPTDATAQMYSFIRLRDATLRDEIATITGNAHFATASEAFIVCADVHRLERILKSAGQEFGDIPAIANHFGIGDAVMAAENLLLASEMLGYRGCWIGGVLNALEKIIALTELPKGVLPFAGLTIGVPDEEQIHRPRIARELVVHVDRYRTASTDEISQAVSAMASITARGNWAQTLARYFAKGGTMEQRETVLKAMIEKQLMS
jgi:FMN reductase (NADPH)